MSSHSLKDLPWESFRFFRDENPKSYPEIWDFQKQRVEAVAYSSGSEALIFCEHELCITTGKRSQDANLLPAAYSVPVYEIERGGDVTLHNPGQLVIYPIFKLGGDLLPKGIHEYLRFVEESLIQVLFEDYQLEAGRFGPTGVWIRRPDGVIKKIASIGVAVRRWVSYHGAAINVKNSLQDFSRIRPCNFESSIMTSLEAEGREASLQELSHQIEQKMFKLLFERYAISAVG